MSLHSLLCLRTAQRRQTSTGSRVTLDTLEQLALWLHHVVPVPCDLLKADKSNQFAEARTPSQFGGCSHTDSTSRA